MKLAVFQGHSILADVEANLRRIADAAHSAAVQGAELIVFPELFLTGYNLRSKTKSLAEPQDGPSAKAIGRIAMEHNIGVVYGYPEKAGDDCYNSAQLINSRGERVCNYRKMHLFGPIEKEHFSSGNEIAVVNFAGLRLGILICYDVEFPEAARSLALAGVDLIAVPTAIDSPYEEIATTVIRSRAYENQVFVAYANHSGSEDDITYVGLSGIVGPDGRDISRAGRTDEALMVTKIEPAAFSASFSRNTYLRDRRPELYVDLSKAR